MDDQRLKRQTDRMCMYHLEQNQLGLKIKNIFIVHFNSDYVRTDRLDVEALSEFTCVTEHIFSDFW